MFVTEKFVRVYRVHFAIVIFMVIIGCIHLYKPMLVYNAEGGFRPFGIGYKHKTVVPIWIVAIILAIFSYLAVTVWSTPNALRA
jgi:hypothetical protein